MDDVMQYLVSSADRGDFQHYLKKSKGKKLVYKGNHGLDLHIFNGKIVKVFHDGVPLKIVQLD